MASTLDSLPVRAARAVLAPENKVYLPCNLNPSMDLQLSINI